jgi:hypothetical protein
VKLMAPSFATKRDLGLFSQSQPLARRHDKRYVERECFRWDSGVRVLWPQYIRAFDLRDRDGSRKRTQAPRRLDP